MHPTLQKKMNVFKLGRFACPSLRPYLLLIRRSELRKSAHRFSRLEIDAAK